MPAYETHNTTIKIGRKICSEIHETQQREFSVLLGCLPIFLFGIIWSKYYYTQVAQVGVYVRVVAKAASVVLCAVYTARNDVPSSR